MIFKTTKPKLKHYNIPPTDENHELLRKAKTAIAQSHPEQALELLSTLKLKTLDIEIIALSTRLSDLEHTNRLGTVSYEAKTLEQNKINESLTLLITALGKEIAPSFEFYDEIRAALKTRYETRLSQKLSNRQPVNLRLVPSTIGTTHQAANTFVQYSEGEIGGKLAEYYKDANGRLLLVGVPGAGKTTLLLQLQLELLEQETTRIPVILNLARWSSTFSTLEDWIQEILPSEMGLAINKKIAADLVAQNRLILLLDGLDEVKAEDRQTCLEVIGIYGEDASRYFILSSRIDEYNAVAKDAPLNSQVEVGTLTYEQLIEQLEKVNRNEGAKRLLLALKEDELLRKIAEIPFYFNTLQLLFARGKYLHEFNFSALDIEGRKKEIEQNFVSEMFQRFTTKDYDSQSVNKYLGFFSSRLKRANLVDFELIDLQYNWCELSSQELGTKMFLSNMVLGMPLGLVVTLVTGFTLTVQVTPVYGLLIGIAFGLVLGILMGFFSIFFYAGYIKYKDGNEKHEGIKNVDYIVWQWKPFFLILLKSYSIGLFFVLFIVLNMVFVSGWSLSQTFRWNDGINELVVMIALFCLAGTTSYYIKNNNNSFIQVNNPFQRFRASAKAFHFSIIQHCHLRRILQKKELLPKKLVPFLNDMVTCNILETTGASWRFRHWILQDYFADQWVETEFEPEQK